VETTPPPYALWQRVLFVKFRISRTCQSQGQASSVCEDSRVRFTIFL